MCLKPAIDATADVKKTTLPEAVKQEASSSGDDILTKSNSADIVDPDPDKIGKTVFGEDEPAIKVKLEQGVCVAVQEENALSNKEGQKPTERFQEVEVEEFYVKYKNL